MSLRDIFSQKANKYFNPQTGRGSPFAGPSLRQNGQLRHVTGAVEHSPLPVGVLVARKHPPVALDRHAPRRRPARPYRDRVRPVRRRHTPRHGPRRLGSEQQLPVEPVLGSLYSSRTPWCRTTCRERERGRGDERRGPRRVEHRQRVGHALSVAHGLQRHFDRRDKSARLSPPAPPRATRRARAATGARRRRGSVGAAARSSSIHLRVLNIIRPWSEHSCLWCFSRV